MKEWVISHRRLAVALALGLEWALLVAVGLAFGRTPIDAIVNSALWTVISGTVLAFELRRKGRLKVQLDAHGQVYVRYPDSLPGSLSGIWNFGIAKPVARCVDFQPVLYDTLEPSGRPTKINVFQVLPDRRRITRKDRTYVSGFGIQVISLVSDKGKVDIAGNPESLEKLIDALEGAR